MVKTSSIVFIESCVVTINLGMHCHNYRALEAERSPTQKAASLNFDISNRKYGFTVLIKRAEKKARDGRVTPDELGFSSKRKALPARAI